MQKFRNANKLLDLLERYELGQLAIDPVLDEAIMDKIKSISMMQDVLEDAKVDRLRPIPKG